MCGIVAYIGSKPARELLLEGLKRLEYRGYDSAGIAVLNGGIKVARSIGRVAGLEEMISIDSGFDGTVGIAHTRWATHGEPSERNAHPHSDNLKNGHGIHLVHNGIIENYVSLKKYLISKGHEFTSDTDTEVLAHLIGELYDGDLETAVQSALREVTGAYAIAVVCEEEPEVLVVARKGSPLIVGVGKDEYVVASDSSAIVAHTTQAFLLDDETVARLTRDSFRTTTVDNVELTPEIKELEFTLEQIELGNFDHFMLKEIYEQPNTLRTCIQGRVDAVGSKIVLGGVADFEAEIVKAKRILMLGQGTALHAAMIGEYLFEKLAGIPTEVEFASEFRYRNPIVEENTVAIAVSQSGETADTLAAVLEAKRRGALTFGAVNVVGSTISRETDAGVYLRVGPEIGVASTKAFIGQVAVLTMLATYIGRRHHLDRDEMSELLSALEQIPDHISTVLGQSDHILEVTKGVVDRDNWLFLGRGTNYPVALEGALKLKEISYIHAEGMPAAEMKHGPIALIDKGMPVVIVATRGSQYEKVIGNMEEVRSRGGHVIAVATEGDTSIVEHCDDVFYVPDVPEPLQPLVTVVPLQLLAYHAAVLRGKDVDKPRNLAKSVTVE
ncbi:MAG TPA: glutamine--fructose-6-phosphate transaminase (isomerizing) [Phycisphaerales bacterium]|nr:glutamine--fructose-6-phosphate transaminase (isomerizing) [Phycisphaerales bacterium]HIB01712.1 glutamine--fructose-6-phosphate transaminase (isomerizing) [Phycisphaerales bacterium]HIB51025.1 glutamine--fructose-6-phosphate transaminase (isomerizing) [Phycisphaerales bacterium]HIN84040.1 glutamine--fructose-6-phosphate transaminase (isomerizing) [Phycisphaerales bacterium]HIO53037.1 glutamine--fructose-6-phosphate transaminase (isomerizing) [Phycisphaerales bacterium]